MELQDSLPAPFEMSPSNTMDPSLSYLRNSIPRSKSSAQDNQSNQATRIVGLKPVRSFGRQLYAYDN